MTHLPVSPLTEHAIFAEDFGSWRAQWRKYYAIGRINLNNSLAYVWDAFSPTIFIMLFVYIFAQLWTVTFASQNASEIGGLTLNQTIWYFVWAELIQLTKADPSNTIQQEVKEGSLAYTLGRPYNYLLYHFFQSLGASGLRIVAVLAAGSVVAWTQTGALHSFNLPSLPLLLVVTLFALAINFCIMAMIGLLAFLFEEVSAFRLVYSKINFIIGGLLIPIDFLPEGVQAVVRYLPFNLILYAPSKLFVAWDSAQFAQVIVLQGVWLGILGGLLTLFFRYGVQRVTINGG
jgi:ABC-2 type transport system permease protein